MSNENGTVAVKFLKSNGPFMPGDVAGFEPAIAKVLIAKKIAVDPNATTAEASTETSAPADTGKPTGSTPSANPDDVAIPDNWESEHHLQLIALAKKIKPDEKDVNKARAIEIITTEIERRKANEQ